jgi:hypothetical protein
MPRQAPTYIVSAGVIGAPIKYKWNSDIGLGFYDSEVENIKLYEAIDASNFKAKMAIAVAITEWIVWRFDGHTNLSDAHLRVEAAWASAIDPAYAKDLTLQMTKDDDTAPVEGPLELALCLLGEIDALYANGNIFLASRIVYPARLARHLMPTKKVYDDWLSATLRRTAQIFPRGPKYDRKTPTYDASHEKPVPREFFDSALKYSQTASDAALNTFLQTLDPKQNPYLHTPQEMKAKGFKGTPYIF